MNITTRNDQSTRRTPPRLQPRSTKPTPDPAAVAAAERAIEANPIGRDMLRLKEDLDVAKIAESATALGSESVEGLRDIVRRQLESAESRFTLETVREAERLRCRLVDAESDAALWRSKLAAARTERERLEVELSRYAEGLQR